MRNSKSGSTPRTNTVQNEKISKNAEKSNGKKLKQARLPFKLITPSTSPLSSKTSGSPATVDKGIEAVKSSADVRKRKLSYDSEDDDGNVGLKEDDNVSKENVVILAAVTKKKKLASISSKDNIIEVVSLLDDDGDNENPESNKDVGNTSIVSIAGKHNLETSAPKTAAKDKRKGAGTPKTINSQHDKNGSATKLQIKLPLSAGKKKRRKSSIKNLSIRNAEEANEELNSSTQELSSDNIHESTTGINPSKRKKLGVEDTKQKKTLETNRPVADQQKEIETVKVDSDSEAEKKNQSNEFLQHTKEESEKKDKKNKSNKNGEKVEEIKSKNFTRSQSKKLSPNTKTAAVTERSSNYENIEILDSTDDSEEQKDEKDELEESVLSDNDNEADDETDHLAGKSVTISTNVDENSKTKSQTVERIQSDEKSTVIAKKSLTPKQIKLMEQRKKAREEKERKLEEEKLKKQQEKEEKELARKREREEKEEQKRKEREEKEDQKRKEREEKERKRLAELEAKNEEKRKKNEAKEEELRKKEEERKRKEHEKEEAELKKKKAAQAFTKFFVAKTPNNNQPKNDEDSNTGDGAKLLAFRPFQIKGDMKLAPVIRKNFTTEARTLLDDLLDYKSEAGYEENNEIVKRPLYLSELRSGKILPGSWRRPSTESKDDVIIVEDELERVGLEIVEEIPAKVREEMRVKFYKFHDNRRPPYYGTWRKKSSVVKPRNPFAQDKKFFDYEIDSDDEWEEEEPGESLEDGSDEDKEKESEDDDYEVDNEWFVPHGHLSDEEMQNEDDFGLCDDGNTREAQKAKLQLLQQEFAQEMKKKTEKIKPRLIGCIWTDINGNQPPECAKILWDTLEKKSMLLVDPPLVDEPEVDRQSEANSPSGASSGNLEKASDKLKPITLSDNMIRDLSRLIHGNNHSKTFLINEYIAFVEKTEEAIKNGDFRKPQKTVVREKIDEIAEWQAVDDIINLQKVEDTNVENNDKRKKKAKRRCWVVKQEILDKMDLSSLKLQNSWQYILQPKFVKPDKTAKTDETTTALTDESKKTSLGNKAKETDTSLKDKPGKSLNPNSTDNKDSNETSNNAEKLNTSTNTTITTTTTTPKNKKRVSLLMSAARGQQASTPSKNKLISQFLQQKNKGNDKTPSSPITAIQSRSKAVTSPNIEDDDVVMLD